MHYCWLGVPLHRDRGRIKNKLWRIVIPSACSVAGGVSVLDSDFSQGSMKSAHGAYFEGCVPKWREESSILKKSSANYYLVTVLPLPWKAGTQNSSCLQAHWLGGILMLVRLWVCADWLLQKHWPHQSLHTLNQTPDWQKNYFFLWGLGEGSQGIQVDSVSLHLQLYLKCICSTRFAMW